jgi:hypothetical protein
VYEDEPELGAGTDERAGGGRVLGVESIPQGCQSTGPARPQLQAYARGAQALGGMYLGVAAKVPHV